MHKSTGKGAPSPAPRRVSKLKQPKSPSTTHPSPLSSQQRKVGSKLDLPKRPQQLFALSKRTIQNFNKKPLSGMATKPSQLFDIPAEDIDQFFTNNPDMKALVDEVEAKGSLKFSHDLKSDVKLRERELLAQMPDDLRQVLERNDEEEFLDDLLYDNQQDGYENTLKQQHQQLRNKQQVLNQQRVLNMNEFIRPPDQGNPLLTSQSFQEVVSLPKDVTQRDVWRANEEKLYERRKFEDNIQTQRQKLQKQLQKAALEEQHDPDSMTAYHHHHHQQQQQQLKRAGPGDDGDFLKDHGFDLNFLNSRQTDSEAGSTSGGGEGGISSKQQRAKTNPVPKRKPLFANGEESTGGEDGDFSDDGDGDDDDSAIDQDGEDGERDEDIDAILARQYMPSVFSSSQGIASDPVDGEGQNDLTGPRTNKHGYVIDPDFITPAEMQERRELRSEMKRVLYDAMEKDYKQTQRNRSVMKRIKAQLREEYPDITDSDDYDDDNDDNGRSDLDEEGLESDTDDPVKKFVFADKTDPLARSQTQRIPVRWKPRVQPIIDILKNFISNPKGHTSRTNLLQGLDTAARLLLELSGRPDLPDIPRQVFATIINIVIPRQNTIKGIPIEVSRPASAAIGPFLLLVMSTAQDNGIKFSDVEWQWVLNSIAHTANIVNSDDVRAVLEDALALFRKSQVIRGVRVRRERSNVTKVTPKDPVHTKQVLISAPNVRLIEQRAWVEFHAYSHNRDLLLPFTRIHDAVVFKPSRVDNAITEAGFIADHIGEDIMTRPAGIEFHRVDEFDPDFESIKQAYQEFEENNPNHDHDVADPSSLVHLGFDSSKLFFKDGNKRRHKYAHYNDPLHNSLTAQSDLENLDPTVTATPELSEDMINIRFEKAAKAWVSPDHHPQLYNYPDRDDLPYNGYMAAPDDILAEPWLYQPPHFGDKYLPRMCGEFRNDNLAFFPSCVTVMAHFTAKGTADVVQAEQFYKYTLNVLMNTDGYYRHVLKDIKTIDKYRTLHGYEPAEDTQMAQNMEAPGGEEFRYFAGYPLVDGTDFSAWRGRATQLIITMTKQLAKLYKREHRGSQIHNLIQFLFEKKRLHPSLVPVPSMSLLQQYFISSIVSKDVSQARQTVKMMMEMRRMVATPKDDPLLQLSLQTFKNHQKYHLGQAMADNEQAGNENAVVTGTNRRFLDKTFASNAEVAKEIAKRTGQSSFDSLQRELDMAVVISQAALYAASNNFIAIVELLQSLSKSAKDPSHAPVRSSNPEYHDLLTSIEHISPATRTRIFRVILSFLATSSLGMNSYSQLGSAIANETRIRVEKIYHQLKRDFDLEQSRKYPPALVQQLGPEEQQQFVDLQHQIFSKRVRDMIAPIYDELLAPTPLVDIAASLDPSKSDKQRRLTSTGTLKPGHIIWLFHQSQRHGAIITPRLINDTIALLSAFPQEIGNYAAYHFVEDMLGLGFRINRATLRTIADAARRQAMNARPQLAKLYSNTTMNYLYQQLSDTIVTVPQLLDAGQTELPSIFAKEFSFLHPATIQSLAKSKRLPLSASMIQSNLSFFVYTRNWTAAVEYFRNTMDIAYFGNYTVTKSICKAQRIPLSQITDALPVKQRNIAFQARKTLFFSASAIGHHQLVFDLLADWQAADGVNLLPFRLNTFNFTNASGHNLGFKGSNDFQNLPRLFPIDDLRAETFRSLIPPPKPSPPHINADTDVRTQEQMQHRENERNEQGDGELQKLQSPKENTLQNELEIAEQIRKLPFDQQKILLQTVNKIRRKKQPPISQHFNISKRPAFLNDIFDIALLSHDTDGATWQRRYMEHIGVSPGFKTISKVLSTALGQVFKSTGYPHPNVLTHIEDATATRSFRGEAYLQFFNPSLSVATPITTATNPQLGISVGYADNRSAISPDSSTAIDDFQFKHAQLASALHNSWDTFVQRVSQSKLPKSVKNRIQSMQLAHLPSVFRSHLSLELQKFFLPNHYSSIQEHTLTIKSAAQRLLDHYPFESANDAIAVICNSRIGLGDFGIEYEPHKTPLLTQQLAELNNPNINFDPLNVSKPIHPSIHSNPRALSHKLQQHQRSYQNMTKMHHEKLILPLSLMIDSPALHVPGLALLVKEPVPFFEDDEAQQASLIAPYVTLDPETKQFALKPDLDVTELALKLAGTRLVKRHNLMIGTEHIDAALSEMFWRGLTITPFHVFSIVRSMFDQTARSPRFPQVAIPALPYIAALTHNMDVFPILDRSNRAQHGLSSTNIRQHHTLDDARLQRHNDLYKVTSNGDLVNETEERVVSTFSRSSFNNSNTSLRTDNNMITLDKVKGQFVVYQHEVVQLQFSALKTLSQQFSILFSPLSQALQAQKHQLAPRHPDNLANTSPLPDLTSLPYPNLSLTSQVIPHLRGPIPMPKEFSTIHLISQLQDHYRSVDILLRRLAPYLPPQDSQCLSIGWFANEKCVEAIKQAHRTPITDDNSIQERTTHLVQSVLGSLSNDCDTDNIPTSLQKIPAYHPIVPELQLPQTKPTHFPQFYTQTRNTTKLSPTHIDEIPDLSPKPSNYTESVLFHTNFPEYDKVINLIAELPFYQANINSIILHPRFVDNSRQSEADLDNKTASNCFQFTPRAVSNNKQSQLLLMMLFRYRQPSETITQHLTNWHDESQHMLEQVHLAFKQLLGIDLSDEGELVPEDSGYQEVQKVLKQYTKQPFTTTALQLITGIIDMTKSTLPTDAQLKWLDTMITDEQVDLELLQHTIQSPEALTEYSQDQLTSVKAHVELRSNYVKKVRAFIAEMDACSIELKHIETYLPVEAQFTPSTYTSHVTLTPAPYHPDTSEATSQSFKLWIREALSTLQSARLAPNGQQLAVLANTGPIVNYNMFDRFYLTHHFKDEESGIQSEKLYPNPLPPPAPKLPTPSPAHIVNNDEQSDEFDDFVQELSKDHDDRDDHL